MTQTVQIHNQTFILHPTGAMYWKERSSLLISDVHLGKVSHFRKFGAPVPRKAILKNFVQLNEAIDFFRPVTVCFLGDLFHSAVNKEWQLFDEWVHSIRLNIILVEGNHDIISP